MSGNFAQFFEVIYRTERVFARKCEVNFRSEGILRSKIRVVENNRP